MGWRFLVCFCQNDGILDRRQDEGGYFAGGQSKGGGEWLGLIFILEGNDLRELIDFPFAGIYCRAVLEIEGFV
jgi:hypothetical protein